MRLVARLVGINHVAVEVGEIEAALAFFEQIFGELRLRGRIGSRMAFVDIGDQFIALAVGPSGRAGARHVGLVVDDREAVLAAARAARAELSGNDLVDPWGNVWQIVDYRDVQFTKAPQVLHGMGFAQLAKSESALAELREKGLTD